MFTKEISGPSRPSSREFVHQENQIIYSLRLPFVLPNDLILIDISDVQGYSEYFVTLTAHGFSFRFLWNPSKTTTEIDPTSHQSFANQRFFMLRSSGSPKWKQHIRGVSASPVLEALWIGGRCYLIRLLGVLLILGFQNTDLQGVLESVGCRAWCFFWENVQGRFLELQVPQF